MSDVTIKLLLYFILPVWLLAGFADYLCHRASRIQETTGAKESLIHLLLFAEVGVPLLAALFLEINSLVILLMILGFIAHEATSLWDVSYAVTARNVTPLEQHVHSFLELIPLMATLFVLTLRWPQFLALFGVGSEPARFGIVLKIDPVPVGYVVTLVTLVLLFNVLPYLEELVRGLKCTGGRLVPRRAREAPAPR